MAVNDRTFIRIMPESTGDRVGQLHAFDVEYTGKTRPFAVDEIIVGGTSGTQARVLHDTPDNDVATAGVVATKLEPGFEAKSFTSGEALQVLSSTIATSGSNYCIYIGKTTLAGGNNPSNLQSIDGSGQAFVRFAEGAPQLDAFGKLQISNQHKIAEYVYNYDELPNDFYDYAVGSATLSYQANTRGVTLQCTTLSGDHYQRTSDEYHVYQAGVSQLIEMTVAVGDTGKANVNRKWGYYDDDNGLMFALVGTSLSVVQRSKSTGSVVDTVIAQADWNEDTVDGSFGQTNLSRTNLNVSKDNIYWIDLQWLGAGSVRFGIVVDGVRIVCHEIRNANVNDYSYMTTGSLPFRYEQENTGTAASTSQLKVFCATVKTEGTFNPFKRLFTTQTNGYVAVSALCSAANPRPLIAFRPLQNYKSRVNRTTLYPVGFHLYNVSASAPVVFNLVRNGIATDGAYISAGGESTAAVNNTCTTYTGGTARVGTIIGPKEKVYFPFPAFSENRRGLRRGGDSLGSTTSQHVYTCHTMEAAASANVYMVYNWEEVRD